MNRRELHKVRNALLDVRDETGRLSADEQARLDAVEAALAGLDLDEVAKIAVIDFAERIAAWLLRGERGTGLLPSERKFAEQVAPAIVAFAREERSLP